MIISGFYDDHFWVMMIIAPICFRLSHFEHLWPPLPVWSRALVRPYLPNFEAMLLQKRAPVARRHAGPDCPASNCYNVVEQRLEQQAFILSRLGLIVAMLPASAVSPGVNLGTWPYSRNGRRAQLKQQEPCPGTETNARHDETTESTLQPSLGWNSDNCLRHSCPSNNIFLVVSWGLQTYPTPCLKLYFRALSPRQSIW